MTTSGNVLRAADRARLLRSLRRGGPWWVLAVVLALISIPAAFDLHGLLVALAVITGVLGLVTALFTWFDKRAL